MPRYVRQRDRWSCGPIAVLNALRWVGLDLPYSFAMNELWRDLHVRPPKGTCYYDVDDYLKAAAKISGLFKVQEFFPSPPTSRLIEHLQAGGAIIFRYRWKYRGKVGYHLEFLADCSPSGRRILAINARKRKTKSWFNLHQFKACEFSSPSSTVAWLLTRKDLNRGKKATPKE